MPAACNVWLTKGPAFFGDGLCKVVHHIIARVSEQREGPVQVIPWRRLQLDLAHKPRWHLPNVTTQIAVSRLVAVPFWIKLEIL